AFFSRRPCDHALRRYLGNPALNHCAPPAARSRAFGMTLRKKTFSNLSGTEIRGAYTPADIADFEYDRDLGEPGQFPFTRGIYPTMYRGRLWTMRQFSGFATARETNRRYRYLLSHGNNGLSVAFDMPTLMGYDSDHPRSKGEVGRCGVAIDSVSDMES